jgi:hypothetical protein
MCGVIGAEKRSIGFGLGLRIASIVLNISLGKKEIQGKLTIR